MLLTNKVAVIAGSWRGIGGAVVRAFAGEGGRLFLTASPVALVEAVARTPGSYRSQLKEDEKVTLEGPITDLDPRFSSPGATALPWSDAEEQLKTAEVFWLSTARPDGRPHVTPLLAVWMDGALYFCTGEAERKGKNLAENARVVMTTGQNALADGLDIVVEGEAARVSDEARLHRLADAYVEKYGAGWRYAVGDGVFHPDTESVVQDAPVRIPVFEVRPTTVFGFGRERFVNAPWHWTEAERFSQTRWRFQTSPVAAR